MSLGPESPRRDHEPRSSIEAAVAALRAGQVVAVPTDTVYGLAVDPSVPGATDRLFDVKRRTRDVDLPVLVADTADAQALCAPGGWTRPAQRLAARFWPGALTLIVARRADLEWNLGSSIDTIGIRCPDHEIMRDLCRRVGPLAVSSANRHGHPALELPDAVRLQLGDDVAVLVDGGRCSGSPSTVADLTGSEARCVRNGGVSWAQIEAALA